MRASQGFSSLSGRICCSTWGTRYSGSGCSPFYFEETGSTLDLNVIIYSLTTLGEIGDVIDSVASPAVWALAVAVMCYVVLGPWLVTWLVCRWRRWRNRRAPTRAPTRASRLGAAVVCLAGVALAFFSVPVEAGGASISFSRDAVVNVITSRVEYARLKDVAEDANVSPREPPADTWLKPTVQTEKRNVVLIHLESVRSRSVTPYNEELQTTPYLNELAKESLVAERAYTVVPHTSKAIVSVNCGIEPHLVRKITEADGVPARCLADLLGEQGYDSVWFSSATEDFEDRPDLVKNFGYDEFYPVESMAKEGFQKSNYFGYEDDIMLGPSREWLEEHRDKPFLATYLGVTGHHDYRPIDRYGSKDFAEGGALNRYQNEVRYLDFFVKNVIEQYKQMGLYDNTIFVIYGDHGEGFGEHDLYQHDNTIYEEGIRIPLIVHDPGRFSSGERVETLTNELDILPTVFDLLGYEVEGGKYPGRSLLAPPDEDRKLFFSCFDDYRCLASLKGNQKYIYFFGDQPQEQDHGAAHSQKAADEEVAADGAPDQECGVHAQGFDEEAPDGVEAHVEQHYIPVPEAICEAAGDPEQRQADEQVPDRLVEEGRVKGLDVGELGGSVLGCYPYGPRQVGGPSEELLVEVVAPAAYGLGEDEARRGRIGEDERAYATVPAEEEHAQKTSRHGTVDPQAPVPDLEDAGDGVACVEVVVGDDVVDASPDEA